MKFLTFDVSSVVLVIRFFTVSTLIITCMYASWYLPIHSSQKVWPFQTEVQVKVVDFSLQLSDKQRVVFSFQNSFKDFKGVSFGVFNRTETLSGVQIGLWNVVESNPLLLKRLPLINVNFKSLQ